jgi:hydrogenase nickel incorporation protein HypA/HybF
VHELSLLVPVVAAVRRAADAAGAAEVEAVGLRVGTMSGAVPEALAGAWPIAVADVAPLRHARLDIEVVPAAIWCPGCRAQVEIDEFYALTCPVCGTPSGDLVHGREFEVTYAEIPDP